MTVKLGFSIKRIRICRAKRGWILRNLRLPSILYNIHLYLKFYYYFMLTELRIYLGIWESRLNKNKGK